MSRVLHFWAFERVFATIYNFFAALPLISEFGGQKLHTHHVFACSSVSVRFALANNYILVYAECRVTGKGAGVIIISLNALQKAQTWLKNVAHYD